MGCEVKSLREGHTSLDNSFVQAIRGELWLKNCYIKTYEKATAFCPDERQSRKLLMNKNEISKIQSIVAQTGLSVVPLKIYFNQRNLVKVEIAIARGKKLYDKRKSIKERDLKRELARKEQWVHSKGSDLASTFQILREKARRSPSSIKGKLNINANKSVSAPNGAMAVAA